MVLFRKFAVVAICLGFFVVSATAAKKDDKPKDSKELKDGKEKEGSKEKPDSKSDPRKKKGKEKEKGKGKGQSEDGETPSKGKLSLPIIPGHDAFGLKIPYFNTEGKLQMVFNIGRASRIDESRVTMSEMLLETFDDEGKSEMTIDLPVSVLNLNTNVLSTETNVTIKRSDFEITGHSMEFNTETRQGRLAGNVRMLIYNLEDETAQPEKDETSSTQ